MNYIKQARNNINYLLEEDEISPEQAAFMCGYFAE